MGKKSNRISPEVKADILKRVKEDGIPVSQAAKEHGVSDATIYSWLTKGATGSPSWSEFARLQKQNKELLELVGELTLLGGSPTQPHRIDTFPPFSKGSGEYFVQGDILLL